MLVAGPVRASHQPDKVERGVVPVFFFFSLQIFLFYWVGIHEAVSGRQIHDSVVGLLHIDSQRPSANTQGGNGGRARMLALVTAVNWDLGCRQLHCVGMLGSVSSWWPNSMLLRILGK